MWVEGAGFLTSMAPCTGLRSFKGEEGYKTLSLYSGGFYAGLWGGGGGSDDSQLPGGGGRDGGEDSDNGSGGRAGGGEQLIGGGSGDGAGDSR